MSDLERTEFELPKDYAATTGGRASGAQNAGGRPIGAEVDPQRQLSLIHI